MIKIRKNVFETNSSSVHSLCMTSKDKIDRWKKGELIWDNDSKEFVEPDGLDLDDEYYRYYTYDDFFNNYEKMDFDTFCDSYETESGEVVYAFGYYGYDS